MRRLLLQIGHRNLVRTPSSFNLFAINHLWPRPAFRRSHHDHRPLRQSQVLPLTRIILDRANLLDNVVEGCRHELVHVLRFLAFNEVRFPTIAGEQLGQLLVAHAPQHGWIRNLVFIQMQDRQHCAIAPRIYKFVDVPSGCERPGLGLTIAHDATNQQIRIIECGASSMA